MRRYPYALAIFGGVLHSCPLKENGVPEMEYGSLQWEAVSASVSSDFLEEAIELMGDDFKLKD